jgi:hypothetical protein
MQLRVFCLEFSKYFPVIDGFDELNHRLSVCYEGKKFAHRYPCWSSNLLKQKTSHFWPNSITLNRESKYKKREDSHLPSYSKCY